MGQETTFRTKFLKQFKILYPAADIHPNTGCGIQGYPDTSIKFNGKNAHLEFKASAKAKVQPNQRWYVEDLNQREFARFIYPENGDQIMEELHGYFNSG